MQYDIVIIGAGIVGLATAKELIEQRPSLKILVLEKERGPGLHQSSHNSGVIHSGIYYKPGSAKAKNCQLGYKKLLRFCENEGIEFKICGKLIVATDASEAQQLRVLLERGTANGLSGLKLLSSPEAKEYEPHLHCHSALHVPHAGVVSFQQVTERLCQKIQSLGVEILFRNKVIKLSEDDGGVVVCTSSNEIHAHHIINCAGLYSDRLAEWLNFNLRIRIIPFRGEYFTLSPQAARLVRGLIYPVPDDRFPFLGIHLTRKINDQVEVGPNAVVALSREGYSWQKLNAKDLWDTFSWTGFHVIAARHWRFGLQELTHSVSISKFCQSAQRLIPEISEKDLLRGETGVRAQACSKDGRLLDDFFFLENQYATHVLNAPSPAATSCLAIGEFIASKVLPRLVEKD